MFGEVGLGKALDINLALWTQILLDGVGEYPRPNAETAKLQFRRVAIMNLKKLAGSGSADDEAISVQAFRDKDFIRREVDIINPDVVVTCGVSVNRLFGWIVTEDIFREFAPYTPWRHGPLVIFPTYHPSHRPKDAPLAFARITDFSSQIRNHRLTTPASTR